MKSRVFLRAALLALPLAATALSVASADRFLFLTLTGLNLVAYAALCCRRREQPVALQLLLLSGAAWLAGMPEVWGRFLMPEFHRGDWIAASAGTYVLIQALRSRQPLAGVGGAALVLCLPALLHRAALWPPCLELAPAFLLLHSLRWADTEEARAGLLRWLAVAVWVAHACVWSRMDGGTAGYTITTAALFVIAGYLIARWVTGRWAAWVVPAGAALSLLAMPANIFLDWIKASPAGLLAVMGSFLLFGLGTVAALTKHRWHPVSPDPGERMIE